MTKDKQETLPDLDSWDDFSGEYLKTDIIKEYPVTLVPVDIESEMRDERPKMVITVNYNKKDWKMELNKTNQNFIRSRGIKPKEIIGKKLTFETHKVRNPASNSMVDSFLITNVE